MNLLEKIKEISRQIQSAEGRIAALPKDCTPEQVIRASRPLYRAADALIATAPKRGRGARAWNLRRDLWIEQVALLGSKLNRLASRMSAASLGGKSSPFLFGKYGSFFCGV